MSKNWDGRRVRRTLKNWYYLDHHLDNLTENELHVTQQLYFRLSYLSSSQQKLLARCFYNKRFHRSHLLKTAHLYHDRYHHFTYLIHKLELKLGIFVESPDLSTSMIRSIQLRRLADDFYGIFKILDPKFNQYPVILKLNQLSDEDFLPHSFWRLTKCKNELAHWYDNVHFIGYSSKDPRYLANTRQLEFRLSYLSPLNLRILKAYFYLPDKQRRQIRSEHLARQYNINLEVLLLHRTQGIHQLQSFRVLPKLALTADEHWQIDNDRQDLKSIIQTIFWHHD